MRLKRDPKPRRDRENRALVTFGVGCSDATRAREHARSDGCSDRKLASERELAGAIRTAGAVIVTAAYPMRLSGSLASESTKLTLLAMQLRRSVLSVAHPHALPARLALLHRSGRHTSWTAATLAHGP